MFGSKKLQDRRIAVLAADGFEKVELTMPVAALRAAGAEVEIISLRRGSIRGMNLHEPAGKVPVDHVLDETDPDDYDALLIPGGFINPDLLRQNEQARNFVKDFDSLNKPIAVICHGPWLLASAGRVHGRRLTSWPGIKDDIKNAGGLWKDEPVVRDGNWVSSRGPHDLLAFNRAMVQLFAEKVPEAQRLSVPKKTRRWPKLLAGSLTLGAAAIVVRARQLSAQT